MQADAEGGLSEDQIVAEMKRRLKKEGKPAKQGQVEEGQTQTDKTSVGVDEVESGYVLEESFFAPHEALALLMSDWTKREDGQYQNRVDGNTQTKMPKEVGELIHEVMKYVDETGQPSDLRSGYIARIIKLNRENKKLKELISHLGNLIQFTVDGKPLEIPSELGLEFRYIRFDGTKFRIGCDFLRGSPETFLLGSRVKGYDPILYSREILTDLTHGRIDLPIMAIVGEDRKATCLEFRNNDESPIFVILFSSDSGTKMSLVDSGVKDLYRILEINHGLDKQVNTIKYLDYDNNIAELKRPSQGGGFRRKNNRKNKRKTIKKNNNKSRKIKKTKGKKRKKTKREKQTKKR